MDVFRAESVGRDTGNDDEGIVQRLGWDRAFLT